MLLLQLSQERIIWRHNLWMVDALEMLFNVHRLWAQLTEIVAMLSQLARSGNGRMRLEARFPGQPTSFSHNMVQAITSRSAAWLRWGRTRDEICAGVEGLL